MATAWPYFATLRALACSEHLRRAQLRRSEKERDDDRSELSAESHGRALLLQYRRLPPESEPSGMTARAIWLLLGRRNEPLATDLIGIHSRYHGLADTCMAAFLVASWPSAGLRS